MNIGDNIVKIRIKNYNIFSNYYIGHIIPNHDIKINGLNKKIKNDSNSNKSGYQIYELPLVNLASVNHDIEENTLIKANKLNKFNPSEISITVESKFNKNFSIDIENIEFFKVNQEELDKYKDYKLPFFINKSI